MDYPNHTIKPRKHKHLNFEERMTIQIRLKDGYSPYKIANLILFAMKLLEELLLKSKMAIK